MKTPETILTNIGRNFLQSLPQNVAQQTPASVNHHFHLTYDNFGDIFLSGPQSDEFLAMIGEVKKELSPLWDEKTLFNLTEKMVLQGTDPKQFAGPMKSSKRHTAALKIWVDTLLEPPGRWEVYLGVFNLSYEGLPTIVGRVTFVALDQAGIDQILAKHAEVEEISPESSTVKAEARRRIQEDLNQQAMSAAQVVVDANTSTAATTRALREVRRTLDVLNFYADLIHVQPTFVYLPGEAARASQSGLALKQGPDRKTIASTHTTKLAGIWSAMGLFDPHLQDAKDRGFDRASMLLSLEKPNDVESRILAALRWAGQAAADSAIKRNYQKELDAEREQTFLFYAICLESLFCKRREWGEGGATKRLSTRTAHLLCSDRAQRGAFSKAVEKLYDRRSEIVHQGGVRVSEQELRDIRYYASASLYRMLTDHHLIALCTEDEFDQWFLKE